MKLFYLPRFLKLGFIERDLGCGTVNKGPFVVCLVERVVVKEVMIYTSTISIGVS